MDNFTSYELKALAFKKMTGHMAPGKDVAAEAYEAPFKERSKAWHQWREDNQECIEAMLFAAEEFFQLKTTDL